MVGAMPVNIIPKFYNGSMDSHNGIEENEIQVHIGSRVKCGDDFGTIKYIGEIQGYKGIWYGVEWDDAARGKHDGSVNDVQYFKTAKAGAGTFVRPNKITPMKTCADAIREYYGDREDATVAAHRRTVINEWKREMGAPFIEMVGFEKIHQKQKLDRLQEVCVHDQNISKAGDVASLCPNITSLDVSSNLFSNWREVITLTAQLPRVTDLNLSKNRMSIDMSPETLSQLSHHFNNLEKLNLSVCDYDWTDILTLSHLFPKMSSSRVFLALIHENSFNRYKTMSFFLVNCAMKSTFIGLINSKIFFFNDIVRTWNIDLMLGHLKSSPTYSSDQITDLIAAFNRIKYISPVPTLTSLTVLRLDGNPIDSWTQIVHLGYMRNLKVLSLNECQITEIRFPEDVDEVELFDSLDVLFLNRNRIHDWRSISELNKLPHLKKLYFLKNPIQNSEDYDTGSQIIIAKIATLQELNGSTITPEHRRGAEYDYMKRYGAEWKLTRDDPLHFHREHSRFQSLINKYGIPDDSLLVKQQKNFTLTSQLLEITLQDENGKTIKKKFPSTMAVQKLVTLAQRLFTKFGHRGSPALYLQDEQLDGREIILDNNMKDLAYFSVKNGDVIVVRFR